MPTLNLAQLVNYHNQTTNADLFFPNVQTQSQEFAQTGDQSVFSQEVRDFFIFLQEGLINNYPTDPEDPEIVVFQGCDGSCYCTNQVECEVDPCDEIEEQRQNESYQRSINTLSMNFGLERETGFGATRSDGSYENVLIPDDNNAVIVPINSNVFGYTHVHQNPYVLDGRDIKPKPIFSVDDFETFLLLVFEASENNLPVNEVFAGVLSSTNHYQLRFTGDPLDFENINVGAELGVGGAYTLERLVRDSETPAEAFLKYLNTIEISPQGEKLEGVELYELLDDGSTVKLNLNEAGTGLLPPTPCD